MFTVFSPLEQFSVYKIISLQFSFIDLSLTNSSCFAVGASALIFVIFSSVCSNAKIIPTI
jgi:hypothetical protein